MATHRLDKETYRVLKELDVEAALKMHPQAAKIVVGGYNASGRYTDAKETALAGLHRARLKQPKLFTPAEKQASRQWLFDRGWRVDL